MSGFLNAVVADWRLLWNLLWKFFFVGVLPLLTLLFGFLQIILKLKKRVKELEGMLEKQQQTKNPEN